MASKKTNKKGVAVAPAVLRTKAKPKKARPLAKQAPQLTAARLRELAANHKPPQSWYEEDLSGI